MILQIPINKIEPNPWQTRIGEPDPEYIKELALDIASNGLMQTPIARNGSMDASGEPLYELAFGHNRLAAFRWLFDLRSNSDIPGDFSTMPVDIRDLTDEQMMLMAWSENEKRRDVNPIERALAIQKRMEDFSLNQTEIAEKLGIARPTVSNLLRLLKLPENVRQGVIEGKISERAASAILPIYDIPQEVIELANKEPYTWNNPAQLEEQALEGASSDELRSRVDTFIKNHTRELQNAEFTLDQMFPENDEIYCGLCRTCDKRIKASNVCPNLICYNAKIKFYRNKYLLRAGSVSGFAPVDDEKGGYVTQFYLWQGDTTQKIISTKCENLRLQYSAEKIDASDPRAVAGFPHARIVCDKRNQTCTCMKGLEIVRAQTSTDEPVSADQLEDAARQARKDKRDVVPAAQQLSERLQELTRKWLQDDVPGAFFLLAYGHAHPAFHMNFENLESEMAERMTTALIGNVDQVESKEKLYQLVNSRLERLNLPQIDPVDGLVTVFSNELDVEFIADL